MVIRRARTDLVTWSMELRKGVRKVRWAVAYG